MKLTTVNFQGQHLEVTTDRYVVVKDICAAIGLDFARQFRKIKSDPTYESKLLKVKTAGGIQEVFCIPLDKLNGWLFSINPNKTKPEVREKLIIYKKECFRVLYEHFNHKTTPTQLDMITPYEVRRDLATTRRLLTIEKKKHRATAEYYEKKLKALEDVKPLIEEHWQYQNENAKLRRENAELKRVLIDIKDRYHKIVKKADDQIQAMRKELVVMTNLFQTVPNLANDGKNLNTDTLSKHLYWN